MMVWNSSLLSLLVLVVIIWKYSIIYTANLFSYFRRATCTRTGTIMKANVCNELFKFEYVYSTLDDFKLHVRVLACVPYCMISYFCDFQKSSWQAVFPSRRSIGDANYFQDCLFACLLHDYWYRYSIQINVLIPAPPLYCIILVVTTRPCTIYSWTIASPGKSL